MFCFAAGTSTGTPCGREKLCISLLVQVLSSWPKYSPLCEVVSAFFVKPNLNVAQFDKI